MALEEQIVTIYLPNGQKHVANGDPDLIAMNLEHGAEIMCMNPRGNRYVLRAITVGALATFMTYPEEVDREPDDQ